MALLFVILIFVPWAIHAENKTKRSLSYEFQNYEATNPAIVYGDSFGSYSSNGLQGIYSNYKSPTFVNVPQPQVVKVYDQPTGANVGGRQILYEYQETPSNVVQPKQSFQSANNFNQHLFNPNIQLQKYQVQATPPTNIFHNSVPSETVILPAQQRQQGTPVYTNNGQVYPIVKSHPLYNSNQNIPKRFFYINGKVNFDSNQLPRPQQNMNQPQANTAFLLPSQQSLNHFQHQQRTPRPPITNYVATNPAPRPNLITQRKTSPLTVNKVTVPQRKPLELITEKPKAVVLKEDEDNEQVDEDFTPFKENEEAETNSEEKDDHLKEHEENPVFGKYSFDYEDNDEHVRNHKESDDDDDDEDEEDSRRDSTKYEYKKKVFKNGKPNTGEYVKRLKSNEDETNNKNERPKEKSPRKSNKKPKMVYKSVKFSREISDPKTDMLEGRHSENLPVTHKQKFFKEKWYISRNTDDDNEKMN